MCTRNPPEKMECYKNIFGSAILGMYLNSLQRFESLVHNDAHLLRFTGDQGKQSLFSLYIQDEVRTRILEYAYVTDP